MRAPEPTVEIEPFAWVDAHEHEDGCEMDKSNDLDTPNRLKELEDKGDKQNELNILKRFKD